MRLKACIATFAVIAASIILPVATFAQTAFPDKPVRIVVPFTAGGTHDLVWRTIGKELSERWKQQVIIDNKPGGATRIGIDIVYRAPADGYTLLGFTQTLSSVRFVSKMDYNPVDAFVPIAQTSIYPLVLTATASLPITTTKELIEYAKSRPGELMFGSIGFGGDYLLSEMLQREAGIKFTVVQYKGAVETVSDLRNGVLHLRLDSLWGMRPLQKEGKARILAVAPDERFPLAPELPTLAEASGHPDLWMRTNTALFARKEVPKEIIDKINADVAAVLANPTVADVFANIGMVPAYIGPEAMAKIVRDDEKRFGDLIQSLGIVPQ
jgi:tripartite-type tricarboxylate transporter receptor subunit TctC